MDVKVSSFYNVDLDLDLDSFRIIPLNNFFLPRIHICMYVVSLIHLRRRSTLNRAVTVDNRDGQGPAAKVLKH